MNEIRSLATRLQWLAVSPAARPLRFVGTGGVAGATQLTLFAVMSHLGWAVFLANGLAFLLAAQINFALSWFFTWRDRLTNAPIVRYWATFHGSIALMALLNFAVFAVGRNYVPLLVASALGILAGALGNYASGNLIVFRPWRKRPDPRTPHGHAARSSLTVHEIGNTIIR